MTRTPRVLCEPGDGCRIDGAGALAGHRRNSSSLRRCDACRFRGRGRTGHRPSPYENGLLFGGFCSPLPERRISTLLAIANDAFIDQEDVGFHVALFHGLAFFAVAAFKQHAARFLFPFGNGGKVDAPEVDIGWIHKSHAVGVNLVFGTNASHHADESFFVGIEIANDDLLLGGKLIAIR